MPMYLYVFMGETRIQVPYKGCEVGGYVLKYLLQLKMLVAAVGLFFFNGRDESKLIQTYLLPGTTLGPKAYIGNKVGQGTRYSKSDQFSPTWNSWMMMLCLPSESILENGHLDLPHCRNSTHLPL